MAHPMIESERDKVARLKQENADLRQQVAKAEIELHKAVQDDLEVFKAVAAFKPEEIKKWDPRVKQQVREQMQAAVRRVQTLFGDGTGEGGSTLIGQFLASAKGVIALLDGIEEVGPTGTVNAKADGTPLEMVKHARDTAAFGIAHLFGKGVVRSEGPSETQKQVAHAQQTAPIRAEDLCVG